MKKNMRKNEKNRKYDRNEYKKFGNLDCHKSYTVCNNQDGPFGIIKFFSIPDDLKKMRKHSAEEVLDTVFEQIKSDINILIGSVNIIYLFDKDGSHDMQYYGMELTDSRNYIFTSDNITEYYPSELTETCLGLMNWGHLNQGHYEFAISVGVVFQKIDDDYKYPFLKICYHKKNTKNRGLAVEYKIKGKKIIFGKKRYVNF